MKKIFTLLFLFTLSSGYLFSQVEGTWKMSPIEAALGVGPALGDISWWSSSADDVNVRACYFDDEYVFSADGTFKNVLGDETWLEAWQGVAEDGCGAPIAPHDGSNDATWSYDETTSMLTLTGVGAFLGLPKVINGAEITSSADAAASITYPVTITGDKMIVDINFGPGVWHYEMERVGTTSVKDLTSQTFSFFPNPATNEIQVVSEGAITQLIVRDLTGKRLYVNSNPSQTETINVSDFASGLYLIESRTGNESSVQKMIVR